MDVTLTGHYWSCTEQPVDHGPCSQLYTNDTQTYTPTLEVYQGQNLNATTNATNDTASFNWTTALGIPFGFVNFELRNADADFEFLDQQDAAAAAPTQPGGVVTGR